MRSSETRTDGGDADDETHDEFDAEPTRDEAFDLKEAAQAVDRATETARIAGRSSGWVAMEVERHEFDTALGRVVASPGVVVWKAQREDGFVSFAVERLAQYI